MTASMETVAGIRAAKAMRAAPSGHRPPSTVRQTEGVRIDMCRPAGRCRFRRGSVVLTMTVARTRRSLMNYLLLINHGRAPTLDDPQAWGSLSQEEQKAIFAGYQEVSQTPG